LSCRQCFCRLVANGVIQKSEAQYKNTVIRRLSILRRAGVVPFDWIAESTRWMRKPRTFNGCCARIEVVAPDLLIISEEFGEWEESKRRIDLLAIDKDANLVVIELKRSDDGGHMDLQAIRYAAMVSAMTFERVVELYADHLRPLGKEADARAEILEFLGWGEDNEEMFRPGRPHHPDFRGVLEGADHCSDLAEFGGAPAPKFGRRCCYYSEHK
jgi:hypothetical protein